MNSNARAGIAMSAAVVPVSVKKNTPEKNTLGNVSFQSTKSGA